MTPHRKRILVADDDPAIRDVVRMLLEDAGYDVETTDDAATLRDFPNGLPDLLLLDICLALKSHTATKDLPILLFSANRDAEQIARDAGADGFVAKPFDLDTLLATVARHV